MNTTLVSWIITVLFLSARGGFCQSIDIIAPGSAAGVEGNSSAIPLDTGVFPARFQQVYASSLFGGVGGPISIGQVAFRGDGPMGHPFVSTIANVEIHLSTTLKPVDGLSGVFDQNVGRDDQTIIGRSPFVLSGDGGGNLVDSWSILFDIRSHPFTYNPAAGNLLLDIKVFSGATTALFDAVDRTGDEVSSVFQYGRSLPTSGQTSSLGLATFFAVDPVPEPSTWALFGLGFFGLWAIRRKTTHREGKSL